MRRSAAIGVLMVLMAATPVAFASTTARSGNEVTVTTLPGERNVIGAVAKTAGGSAQPQFFVADRANRAYAGSSSPPPDTPAGPGCQPLDGLRGALCGPLTVTLFTVALGDKDDKISPAPAGVVAHFDGGSGKDIVNGGDLADVLAGGPGADIVKGFGGNDQIDGGGGPDIIQAGPGNDTINTAGDHASDVISCGPGRDTVTADKRDRPHRCERVIRRK